MPFTTKTPARYQNEVVDLTMSKRELRTREVMMNKHYSNMRKIRPTLNTRDPKFYDRYEKYKRYAQLDKSKVLRKQKIKKENEELVQKITSIAAKSTNHYRQEYPSKQRMFMTILAKHGRKLRQSKITKENQLLAERLLKKESTYDRKRWEKDWKRHDHVLNHLSKSAQMGLRRKKHTASRAGRSPKSKLSPAARPKTTGPRKSSDRLKMAGLESLKRKEKKQENKSEAEIKEQDDVKADVTKDEVAKDEAANKDSVADTLSQDRGAEMEKVDSKEGKNLGDELNAAVDEINDQTKETTNKPDDQNREAASGVEGLSELTLSMTEVGGGDAADE
mmetsp:Transcript_17407/g.27813  ORF Transcript_17407/g.27813 Transcript_17407/m.27813 type:complete len:334 (+) Transcript_17407:164-1165(+)